MAGNMTGRLLNNRYLVNERIGIGGMAEVYVGTDNVLGRTVAIKVMLPQYAEDATFTVRFKQEAAAAANLQSPYIVNVYDWNQDSGTYYIVMEFVRGSDLKSAITQRGAIGQRKVAEIGSQVCQALSVAHGQDIIHRDIKPQNIMIQPDGNVKVMDFGIARAKNSVMGKTSAVLGTAHYISPEQAQGKELTAASDIYSLGVVLYEAATGQLPFDGPDAVSVAMKQVNEQPTPPREIRPDLDPALEAIIMKALSKDPNARFTTAREMRHALNDFLAGRQVNIPSLTSAETAVIAETGLAAAGYTKGGTTVIPVSERPLGPGESGTIRYSGLTENHEDERKKKNKRGAIIAVGVVAALAVIALIAFMLLGNRFGGGIEVPDVTGKPAAEATKTLEDAGFTVNTERVFSDSVPADSVVAQTPRGGSSLAKGSRVTLSISQGPEVVTVPNIVNMTASEARNELTKYGLKFEAGPAEHSDTVGENKVARQVPGAGDKAAKGSVVMYYLSAGEEGTPVPNVVGAQEGKAISDLENAGFKVTTDSEYSADHPEGTVIRQSPTAGEKLKSGSTVNIVISNGNQVHSVTASISGEGGSVWPSVVHCNDGETAYFQVYLDDGYEVASIHDAGMNTYTANETGLVAVENVKKDIDLRFEFAKVAPEPSPEPEPEPSGSSSSASPQS